MIKLSSETLGLIKDLYKSFVKDVVIIYKTASAALISAEKIAAKAKAELTIARALVGHPDILILDDSASALDYATDAALRKALRTLPAETTLFIVSQRTSSLRHADQIIVLDDGHVVGIGKHDALMQTCEVYREIHESQFRKGSDVQ